MFGKQESFGPPKSSADALQVDPNQSLRTVLMACPPVKGEEPEMIPVESIDVPKGCSYYTHGFLLGLGALVMMYIVGVAGDFLMGALPKVASHDCAQEQWNTTRASACNHLMLRSFTMGIDLRCHKDKPPDMSEENFKTACDEKWWSFVGIAVFACYVCYGIQQKLNQLPAKVCLYQDLLTVVAINGDDVKAIFYGDITAAKLKLGEITLFANALASYTAPADGKQDESAGRTLTIQAETSVTIYCDIDEEEGRAFADELAANLPVPIEGLESARGPANGQSTSMLTGRVQQVINARSPDEIDHTLHIPKTCDMLSELLMSMAIVIVGWYIFSLIGNTIDWATRNASGKCRELLRPDVDYCSVWMIFWPIKTLSNWSDYFELAVLIIGLFVFVPLKIVWSLDQYYHFDQEKFWNAPCDISEAQEFTVMFWDDVSNAEVIDSGWENKCIRIHGGVTYKLTGGAKEPFQVTAEFKDDQTKDIRIVDPSCASCCCQGHTARVYDRDLQSVTRAFLPGIEIADAEASDGTSDAASLLNE